MKKLLNVMLFGLFLSTNATMATEEVKFDIVHENEIYEIRKYSERLVAQAINDKDSGTFRKLFIIFQETIILLKDRNDNACYTNEK